MNVAPAHLKSVNCKTVLNTEAQARLALGDELYPCVAIGRIRDEARSDGGLTHLALLHAFPAVRMRENELDATLDGMP